MAEELPRLSGMLFPISTKWEECNRRSFNGWVWSVEGCPDQSNAVASMSGALDIVSPANRKQDEKPPFPAEFENTFGPLSCLAGSNDDLFALAQGIGAVQPRLYITCKAEDFFYEDNKHFVQTFSGRLNITYEELSDSHACCSDGKAV